MRDGIVRAVWGVLPEPNDGGACDGVILLSSGVRSTALRENLKILNSQQISELKPQTIGGDHNTSRCR